MNFFRCAFNGVFPRVFSAVRRMNSRLLPVFALLWAVVYCQHTPKPITAVLHAKWPRTPLLVEASEFVASEDNSAFWQFVDATTDIHSTVHTDKELYDAVLEQAEPLLSPLAYSLFIFALSLHTQSPTVEMYQQVATERLRVLGEVECPAFVDVSGQVACSVEQLDAILQGGSAEESTPPQLFGFDHHYPSRLGAQDHAPTAVLYAELGTRECSALHSALAALSREGGVRYVLRHYVKHRSQSKMRLSGYGVELAVKSTEYKAMDDAQIKQEDGSQVLGEAEGSDEVEGFLFNTLKSHHPSLSQQLGEWREHLLQGAREMPELRAWQLQDLGYQTSQRMLSAGPDLALKVMRDTAQNLPTLAKSLSRTQVSKELRQEIKYNQKILNMYGIEPGSNILLLNGMVLQEDSTDVFNLLEVLSSESRLLTGLQGVGLSEEHTQELLNLPVHTEHRSFSVDMRSEAVVWINDLEKDKLYSAWPRSLHEFMKPMFPGMLRQIRRNVFSIVFCLDPTSPEGAELVEYVKLFLDHVVPARLGLLLVSDVESEEEAGEAAEEGVVTAAQLIRLFHYLSQHKSAREALRWLYQTTSSGNLTAGAVMAAFEARYGKTLSSHQDSVREVAGERSEYDDLRKTSVEFFQAKGFDSLPQVLVNGVQLDTEEDLESSVVSQIQAQTFEIQQAVYLKRLNDSSVMYDYFLDKPNVLQRVNRHVVSSTSKQLDLSRAAPPEGYDSFSELSQSAMSAQLASSMHYYSSDEGEFLTKELSVWVLGDVASRHGRELLRNALTFASGQLTVRVAVVHNPAESPGPTHLAVEAALQSQRSSVAWWLVKAILSSEEELTADGVLTIAGGVQGIKLSALEERMKHQGIHDTISAHMIYCSQVLGLEGGASALLSNGRVIGPLATGESFQLADYQMLYQFESSGHASSVLEAVEDLPVEGVGPDEDTEEFRSGLVMRVSSLLRSEPKRRRISLPTLRSQHSLIHLPSSDPAQELQLVAVMDPLSPGAQRLAPLLQTLHVAVPIDLQLFPNPQEKLSELPIKRFYRYVLEPELSFEMDGSESAGPMAVFADLPHSPLLTLQMAVPHSWLVEGVWSPHDLDNIHLAAVERGVHGVFELEHILVEGQCFDTHTSHPIPGLEYSLGTPTQPDLFDTIVMANLGYFQLKAGPGVWTLRLREGRSHDMYTVTSHQGSDSSSTGEDSMVVIVDSFRGKGVVVKVAKRPGMEGKRLLHDDKEEEGEGEGVELPEEEEEPEEEEAEGIWKSLTGFLGGQEEEEEEKPEKPSLKKLEVSEDETINIFSIASGHLYERFLRIMMLSVLKNTRNPVKFWFLKNYLSPTFKDFIPHMAQHYGFEYELVQYRWPRWLHAQTEKQRLIWGYKILFLDVLFPLSVKKIIFVDADQTVRTDLRELLEMDLHGAPYAYTPFCDSRPDMAGFRFWDRGYWKNHLGSRRYHISALYLVDLWRFRQLAAGDRLRGQYQALSQDPNSLANLDQDLPNNMIHSVPIYSLPQEWLWCETWCSNETKPLAKTIDLCNNPLTKEPKLSSARRIVSEWTGYDTEIQLLQESVERSSETSRDHSGDDQSTDTAKDDARSDPHDQKHVEL